MGIIRQQLGKVYHFLIILLLLFGVNAAFNLRYDWGGVSIIVRTYIMVLIFYFIFIFSQLQYSDLIVSYTERYGRLGRYRLFFDIRLFPFIFALVLTVLFTLINYMGKPGWPYDPMIRLLDGKYSNTLFYALILFFVLRQNRRPSIAIPVFMAISVLFFFADKFLYYIFSPGTGIGLIKLGKYIVFIFILVYDYSRSRIKIIKAVIISIAGGTLMFFLTAFIIYCFYIAARSSGRPGSLPLRMLLKTGFISQVDKLDKLAGIYGGPADIRDLVFYSRKYGRDISFNSQAWESVLAKADIETAESVFTYLNEKRIVLDFKVISDLAIKKAAEEPRGFSSSENFKKYYSGYFRENRGAFMQMFNSGNKLIKVWIIDCLAYAENPDAVTFLIGFLTCIDRDISRHAYYALRDITDIDPATSLGREVYDLDVVNAFIKYRDEHIISGH